jgi:hypothetical protein
MRILAEPTMPADLDRRGRRKWSEMTEVADLGVIGRELLANYCRMFSHLMEVEKEKRAQRKAKQFTAMVVTKNGATVLNPLIFAEMRLMELLGRMLVQLGRNSNGKPQEILPQKRRMQSAKISSEKKPHLM